MEGKRSYQRGDAQERASLCDHIPRFKVLNSLQICLNPDQNDCNHSKQAMIDPKTVFFSRYGLQDHLKVHERLQKNCLESRAAARPD
jgi:hypothetical protein